MRLLEKFPEFQQGKKTAKIKQLKLLRWATNHASDKAIVTTISFNSININKQSI